MTRVAAEILARLGDLTRQDDGRLYGRAAWPIVVTLRALAEEFPERVVALPSFLCHAAAAAVMAAGWRARYCDVDVRTGNVPDKQWLKAADDGVRVFLWPHLFGQPAPSSWIARVRRRGPCFVLEDAAQALGAKDGHRPVGAKGDATVVSFGRTKIVDAGSGGALLSSNPNFLARADHADEAAILAADAWSRREAAYRKLFYARKASFVVGEDAGHLRGLLRAYLPLLHPRWEPQIASKILLELATLETRVRARRSLCRLYDRGVAGTPAQPLRRLEGGAPWRYAFTMPVASHAKKERLSEAIRRGGFSVSNWYLPVHFMEDGPGAADHLPATLRLSRTIFQFWVDSSVTKEGADATCEALRAAVSGPNGGRLRLPTSAESGSDGLRMVAPRRGDRARLRFR